MPEERDGQDGRRRASRWEICLEGHLDERWTEWFEGVALRQEADGQTRLVGLIADQAALHGVLKRLRDLGAVIVSVQRTDESTGEDQENGRGQR